MDEAGYRAAEQAYWDASGARPTERWLDLARPATRVRVLELGDGPPTLFIHGGPNAASAFAPLAALLPDRRCIVLDRPGCGLSPPVAYGATATLRPLMVDVLASTLDALGLDRVDVVASSFGGACALWLGLAQPARVGRVVQLGCPAFVPGMAPGPFLRLLATPFLGAVIPLLPMGRGAVDGSLTGMGHHALVARGPSEALYGWYRALSSCTDTVKHERALVRAALSVRGARPGMSFMREELLSVAQPTCCYWGGRDPFWPQAEIERLVGELPDATLEVDDEGGHLPWLDDPARAAGCVRRHLGPSVAQAA